MRIHTEVSGSQDLEPLLAAMADATRLRILELLHRSDLCVCEIQALLSQVSQPLLSHHLALLRRTGLIAGRREGRWTIYALNRRLLKDAGLASLPIFRGPRGLPEKQRACLVGVGRERAAGGRGRGE